MNEKKGRIAVDSTMMDGRYAKGTGLVIRKHIESLVNYRNEFDITLIHKFRQPNDKLYENFNEIVIPRIWDFTFGGVINEFLFFISYWIQVFLGKKEKFDIYFVAYSRLLPSFIFAPAKKFMFYPMDGGPLSAGFTLEKVKTSFQKHVLFFVHKIDRFLVLSKFGQKGIVDLLNIKEEKVPIVYCGVDQKEKIIEDKNLIKKFLIKKYNYPEKYILCVSRWDPHKNILGTIESYKKYKDKKIKENKNYLPLLFVGGKHMVDYSKKVDEKITELSLDKDILISKYVEEIDLPKVYHCAEFLLFASYYEGFGLPVVEAMSVGCPVICSNNSSLNEVGGESALKVDPYNTNEIAEAIYKLENDDNLKNELRKKGEEWVKQFTWESATEKLVQVFRDLENEIKN